MDLLKRGWLWEGTDQGDVVINSNEKCFKCQIHSSFLVGCSRGLHLLHQGIVPAIKVYSVLVSFKTLQPPAQLGPQLLR